MILRRSPEGGLTELFGNCLDGPWGRLGTLAGRRRGARGPIQGCLGAILGRAKGRPGHLTATQGIPTGPRFWDLPSPDDVRPRGPRGDVPFPLHDRLFRPLVCRFPRRGKYFLRGRKYFSAPQEIFFVPRTKYFSARVSNILFWAAGENYVALCVFFGAGRGSRH